MDEGVISPLLSFLQLLCEGHYEDMQNYLRLQKYSSVSVDLVTEVTNMLFAFENNIDVFNIGILDGIVEAINEFVQGPNHAVATIVVDSNYCDVISRIIGLSSTANMVKMVDKSYDETIGTISKGMKSGVRSDSLTTSEWTKLKENIEKQDLALLQLRSKMVVSLLSLLEMVHNNYIPRRILASSDVPRLLRNINNSYAQTLSFEKQDKDELSEASMDVCFNFYHLLLNIAPYSGDVSARGVHMLLKKNPPSPEMPDVLDSGTGRIEIMRDGNLYAYYFRKPDICKRLLKEEKVEMSWKVDRSSQTSKIADFLERVDDAFYSMRNQQYNYRNKLLAFLIDSSKWIGYLSLFLAFVTNILIIATAFYGEENVPNIPAYDGVLNTEYEVLVYPEIFGTNSTATIYFGEPYATIIDVIGVLQIILNLLQAITFAIRDAPLLMRHHWRRFWDKQKNVAKLEKMLKASVVRECRTLAAAAAKDAGEGAVIEDERLLSIYDIFDYRRMGKKEYYQFLKKNFHFFYRSCAAFLRSPIFLWRWIYLIIAVLVTFYPMLSCLLLLEILAQSGTLNQVVKALTHRGRQLLLTVLLGVVLSYIFSVIGFGTMPDKFELAPAEVVDGSTIGIHYYHAPCRTLYKCLVVNFAVGLTTGDLGSGLEPAPWENSEYMALRTVFTLAYFVIITTILMNIIFGIIIDTFGELRSRRDEIKNDIYGTCFICALESSVFERKSTTGDFFYHVKYEHHMWDYLAFIVYLQEKPETEYTGMESYVVSTEVTVDHDIDVNRLSFCDTLFTLHCAS